MTETEVKDLLDEYHLGDRWETIRQWYNGYRIGSYEGLYNPWSVLNRIANQGELAPYWVNTSDNPLIKQLLTKGSEKFKTDLESLLNGKTIKKTIEEGIIFPNLHKQTKTLWSFLLCTGYLSLATKPSYGTPCQLKIPNAEVMEIYKSVVKGWFEETIEEGKYTQLLQSLIIGDLATFSEIFQKFLLSAFSYFDVPADEPELIYHSFVLGVLIGLKDRYNVKSNRESGYGRYDVMLIPKNPRDLGIVIEFKKIGLLEKTDLETAARLALKQIKDRKYDLELQEQGITRILHLGMAFQGKQVAILSHNTNIIS